jgi:hypothetical protein
MILSQPNGHSAAGRIRSTEKCNDLIGNWSHDLPACSLVLQPTKFKISLYVGWDTKVYQNLQSCCLCCKNFIVDPASQAFVLVHFSMEVPFAYGPRLMIPSPHKSITTWAIRLWSHTGPSQNSVCIHVSLMCPVSPLFCLPLQALWLDQQKTMC